MVDDVNKIYPETLQEVMFDLQLKTDQLLKKFKEQNKESRFKF